MKNKQKYFETIKCEDFENFNLSYHNKRIVNTIGMNINLQDYIYPPSKKLLRCKVIYDQEGIQDIKYFSYKKRYIKSFKLVFDDGIDYAKKYLNRENIDSLYKQKDKADEIIIIKNALVTDTSIANIAIFDGSNWITSKIPLLKGTTRARMLDTQMIFEKDITVEILKNAKKIALLNAMIGFDILEDYSFFE
jgi:4-amino-4-deoxychorismate lyase